jgi:hypothetical protein
MKGDNRRLSFSLEGWKKNSIGGSKDGGNPRLFIM